MTSSGGTTRQRAARAVTAGALALPMAGALLLVGAPGASAAVQQPGNGTVFAADRDVRIVMSADHPRGASSLTLTSPGGPAVTVASDGGSAPLTYALDTGCWTYPSDSCTGRVPAANGTWVVEQTGSTTDKVSFVLRIAPKAPEGLAAEPVDGRTVRLSWRRGVEPDLTGYVLSEGGSPIRTISASTCEGTACSATVAYEREGTGEHSYLLQSVRSDGGDGTLQSSGSPASTTLAAPTPSPAPGPSGGPAPGGGGTPGGTPGGGTASGGPAPSTASPGVSGKPNSTASPGAGASASGAPGTTSGGGTTAFRPSGGTAAEQAIAQRRAFATSFSAFGPKLGIPKLPPLPQSPTPDVAPLPDGGFSPTLGFEDQVVRERVESQGPAARVTTVVGNALDSEQLVRSTAGALVLLLIGAHLRRWLAVSSED